MTHGGNIFATAEYAGVAWQQVLDFSASINPLGPSPAAREAILASLDRIEHYPERAGTRLRTRLAAEWGVPGGRIAVGNGATDLLFDWCRCFRTGTIAAPAFGEFHRAWPDAAICELMDSDTWPERGAVVFTRPANPTGTVVDGDAIAQFAHGRSDAVLVDESFLDFSDAPSLMSLACGNLFVLRSLTKFWALPGLRIGALVGDVSAMEATRPPWTVNTLAEAAALASLDDTSHARRTREFVRAEATRLASELGALPGVRVWPTTANYLYVEMARATELTAFAVKRNVLIRDCSAWPGFARSAVRVAVRRRWENVILINLFKEFLCA